MFTSRRASMVGQEPSAAWNSPDLYRSLSDEKFVRFGFLAARPNLSPSPASSRLDCAQSPRFCPWAGNPLLESGQGHLYETPLPVCRLVAGSFDRWYLRSTEPEVVMNRGLPLIDGRRILSIRNPASGFHGSRPQFQVNGTTDRDALRSGNSACCGSRTTATVAVGQAILGSFAHQHIGLELALAGCARKRAASRAGRSVESRFTPYCVSSRCVVGGRCDWA